jgi:N-ethylmaleimide reductase
MTTDLFTPIKLGNLELKNRIVMAPLTRCRAGNGNAPTSLAVEYYAQRASAGLIVSEGSQIAASAVGYPGTPGIYSPEQVKAWTLVTKAVHDKCGHIFLQLWHCGRVSHSSLLPGGELPVAPSAIGLDGQAMTPGGMQPYETPHALTPIEISSIIEQYRSAARNALSAGFDGVEIHGANGYLLDQFLRDGSNLRTDDYGGSLENRARMILEVTEAVVEECGAGRVGIRLSPLQPFNGMHDTTPEATFSYMVEQLNRFGLAYLHVTEMGSENPGVAGPAFDLNKLRKIWKGIYITKEIRRLPKAKLTWWHSARLSSPIRTWSNASRRMPH